MAFKLKFSVINKHGRKMVEKAEPQNIFLDSFSRKTRIFFSCWGPLKACRTRWG